MQKNRPTMQKNGKLLLSLILVLLWSVCENVMAVEVGAIAPDFSLPNTENQTVTLSDHRGQKNVVLVFYRGTF